MLSMTCLRCRVGFSTSELVVDDAHKELLTTLKELQKSERVCSRLMLQLEGSNYLEQFHFEEDGEVDSAVAPAQSVAIGADEKVPARSESNSGGCIFYF